jgi:hypothetical protein
MTLRKLQDYINAGDAKPVKKAKKESKKQQQQQGSSINTSTSTSGLCDTSRSLLSAIINT